MGNMLFYDLGKFFGVKTFFLQHPTSKNKLWAKVFTTAFHKVKWIPAMGKCKTKATQAYAYSGIFRHNHV